MPPKVNKYPRTVSRGEALFDLHCRAYGLRPEREWIFCERKWRIDFAWPDIKLAVEIESSVHRIKGRFATDMEKYNRLTTEGWQLLRFTYRTVKSAQAIDTVRKVLGARTHS